MLLKVESHGDHFLSFLYLSNSTEPQIPSTIKNMITKQGQEAAFWEASVPILIAKVL